MALPAGITPKTVTVGIASFFDGSLADGTVSITAPVNVVHTPTNNPVFSSVMTQKFVNGIAQFNLCPTDAPGLNRVDWTYVLRVTINGALVQPDPVWFTLPTAGPDTVDLDSLVTVPSSAGVPISATVVTSVNGQTGDVTVSGGAGGSAPDATTTVKGVVKLAGDLGGTSALPTVPGLAGKANASHTHPVTDLTATGTKDATTFLRGDNTWATPAGGGGTVTDATTTAKGVVQLAGDLAGTAAAPTVPGLAAKAPTASPTFTGTVSGVTKAMVGLGNVDNTADTAKPISTATQTALNAKLDSTTAAATYVAKTDAIDLEATQDSIAGMFTGGTHSGISFAYNDPGNVINATVTPGSVADATTTSKGAVQLAGDLAGTAAAPTVPGLTGKLTAASNLSDVANAATARTNLGLGTAATQPTTAFDAAGAAAAVLPSQTGNSGKALTTNGTVAAWTTIVGGGAASTPWWVGVGTVNAVFDGTSTVTYQDASGSNVNLNPSGNVYTLIAPLTVKSLTVAAGVTIRTDGYMIYVAGTATVNGTISANGFNAAGATGGAAVGAWMFPAGGAGPNGATGIGAAATAPGSSPASGYVSAIGGAGGASGATAGGANAQLSGPLMDQPTWSMYFAVPQVLLTGAFPGIKGPVSPVPSGSSGGAGAGDGTNAGGGGGAGGGVVLLNCIGLTGTGTISSKGGNGGNGTAGNAAGGGGGGGGTVLVNTTSIAGWSGTVSVAGGTPGTGSGTGNAGVASSHPNGISRLTVFA